MIRKPLVESTVGVLVSIILSLSASRRGRLQKLIVHSWIACLVLGCSHHHYVDLAHTEDLGGLQQRAVGHSFAVTLTDGRKYTAKGLALAPDSTSWVWEKTGARMRVSTSDIEEIKFVRRGKGALHGAGFGCLAGVLVTAGILPFLSEEGSGETQAGVAIAVLGVPIVFGTIVGVPVGAIIGSKEIYHPVFQDSLRTRQQSGRTESLGGD